MKVLDSTFLIDLLNGTRSTQKTLETKEELLTTQINMYEIIRGLFWKEPSHARIQQAIALFDNIKVLPVTDQSIIKSAEISAALMNSGKMTKDADCLIAGIALSHGVKTIVTKNVKDFKRVSGLIVESY